MIRFLQILWQLPQAALGWLLSLVYTHDADLVQVKDGITWVFNGRFPGGISLWPYIFIRKGHPVDRAHEYGHTIQSRRWGWLYLPVVGLASVIHLWFRDMGWIWDRKSDYYAVWPENKADELGGVKRDGEGRRYVD